MLTDKVKKDKSAFGSNGPESSGNTNNPYVKKTAPRSYMDAQNIDMSNTSRA